MILILGTLILLLFSFNTAYSNTVQNQVYGNFVWQGESLEEISGNYIGTSKLSTDKAIGKFSIKIESGVNTNSQATYGFFSSSSYVDTETYSKLSVWVKPGAKSKDVRFLLWDESDKRWEATTSDKNNDSYFKIGEDLVIGKWNNITLDLKQTNGGGIAKYCNRLNMQTNDNSTWYWDEIKSMYSPTINVDLSPMVGAKTELINGALRNKTVSTGTTTESRWDFDTSLEGWVNQSSCTISIVNGTLNLKGTYYDTTAMVASPKMTIDTVTTKVVKIRLKNPTNNTQAYLKWKTNGEGTFTNQQSFLIKPNSDFQEYTINLLNNSKWRNTQNQLAINVSGSSPDYYLDYVVVQSENESRYLNDKSVYVAQTRFNNFPKGSVNSIKVNMSYIDGKANPLKETYNKKVIEANANKLTISGNGVNLYYLNGLDSNKLYYYNTQTFENRKLLDDTDITILRAGYTGTVIFFQRPSGIYYFDTKTNITNQLSSILNDNFSVFKDDTEIMQWDSYNGKLWVRSINNLLSTDMNLKTQFFAGDSNRWFYIPSESSSNRVVNMRTWTVNGTYSNKALFTLPTGNVQSLYANENEDLLFIKTSYTNYYLYDVTNNVLKSLKIDNFGEFIRITENNKLYYKDAYGDMRAYDLVSDLDQSIRPTDVNLDVFTVDYKGTNVYYDAFTGLRQMELKPNNYYDKYLISFDEGQSWFAHKNGRWLSFNDNTTVTLETYGMSINEINALELDDYNQLLSDQEIYSIQIAILMQTPTQYTSAQLNSILITLSGDNLTGVGPVYVNKKSDYDSRNWSSVRKIYPIELQPRQADVVYFISVDGGATLKTYKNGQWKTYNATLIANPTSNWITLLQEGMSNEEIRTIPGAVLTSMLPTNQISIICITEVLDEDTQGYSVNITVDHVENQFAQQNLILKINMTDGKVKEFSNLTKEDVENFMNWLSERQYNRGPVFYRISIKGTDAGVVTKNDFINYFTIESVSVDEMA